MDTQNNDKVIDRELVLHHLDQVLTSHKENLRTQHRTWLLLNIASVILIALSSGIGSLNQNISIFGLALSIPTWLFLLGGAYFIEILFVTMWSIKAILENKAAQYNIYI
jgi:hypothetical protein